MALDHSPKLCKVIGMPTTIAFCYHSTCLEVIFKRNISAKKIGQIFLEKMIFKVFNITIYKDICQMLLEKKILKD